MIFAEILTPGRLLLRRSRRHYAEVHPPWPRRGPLSWATAHDLVGIGEYVWKRLRIITSEDMGLTAPGLAAEIRALYDNWLDQRKKTDEIHGSVRLVDNVSSSCMKARAVRTRFPSSPSTSTPPAVEIVAAAGSTSGRKGRS